MDTLHATRLLLVAVWHWCELNWDSIAYLLAALATVLNGATRHWTGAAGLARGIAWVLERVSVFRSKDAPAGVLGPLKLPLVSVPPTPASAAAEVDTRTPGAVVDSAKRTSASGVVRLSAPPKPPGSLLGLLIAGVLGAACAGSCAVGLDAALVRTYGAVDVVASKAIAAFHVECKSRADVCAKAGVKTAAECAPWVACDTARATFDRAMTALEDGVKLVKGAYDGAKSAGVIK